MPLEERFITFNLAEIYKAISIQSIQENMTPPPEGTLAAIKVPGADNDMINLNIKDGSGNDNELQLERGFFASALVFYCQGSGIPLPRRGKKILNILEDKIVMKIDLEQ